jgi:uncharacterized protein (UPF0548 family)
VFFFSSPSDAQIEQFLLRARGSNFSYPEVGATASKTPSNYNVDHNRISLGKGDKTWQQAMEAVKTWKMFDLGWVRVCRSSGTAARGDTVAVLARFFNRYSLNACRIVYLIGEGNVGERFGFAYGTLTDHAERGEERFIVERDASGAVWYDILAFSQPNQILVRLGYPFARRLQKKFAADSLAAMARVVNG